MKSIIFYYVKNSNDNRLNIFVKENANSLLSLNNGKFYFQSHFYPQKEEILVAAEKIVFDEILYDRLCSIKESAMQEAVNISNEKIGLEKSIGSIDSIIFSEISKSVYQNPQSIFSFVGNLFIKILMGHKLENGNKRVALLFLIGSLRYFGYHLDWSKGLRQNYNSYKTVIEQMVEILENRTEYPKNKTSLMLDIEKMYNKNIGNINSDEVNAFIFKWIKQHSTIAIEWR